MVFCGSFLLCMLQLIVIFLFTKKLFCSLDHAKMILLLVFMPLICFSFVFVCLFLIKCFCYVHALCMVQLHGLQSWHPTLSCCMDFVLKFFIGIFNLRTNNCCSALVKHIAVSSLITMNCFDREGRMQGFQKTQPPSLF
jgi:hypothetical protein